MSETDYAPCVRCGRRRYLGAFCECATEAEIEAYRKWQEDGCIGRLSEPKAVTRYWRPADIARCTHNWILAARGLVRCLTCGAEKAG